MQFRHERRTQYLQKSCKYHVLATKYHVLSVVLSLSFSCSSLGKLLIKSFCCSSCRVGAASTKFKITDGNHRTMVLLDPRFDNDPDMRPDAIKVVVLRHDTPAGVLLAISAGTA
jgi:hypothetical protein